MIGSDIVLRRAVWAEGALRGTRPDGGALLFDHPTGTAEYHHVSYETARWTGPMAGAGFPATELIPSWTADTPGGSFIRIEVQCVTLSGTATAWYNLGNWSAGGVRASVSDQSDAHATVAADMLVARPGQAFTSWRTRVTMLRPSGTDDAPAVRTLNVMASALPAPGRCVPSTPRTAQGVVLDVPPYSQKVHKDGAAWCSPASTAMVLSYWGYDTTLEQAAIGTFDHSYRGCGNWPFNTAFAGLFGASAFVTRLRSLNEAEQFIDAGIPLIASASYHEGEVPGLGYQTGGHLMVIAGFSDTGRLVLNDPAAPTNEAVRTAVGRAEWETAWLNTSRGLVYVIHPPERPLPPPPPQANW
ncbi:C39 family peptidase [Allorhizocola rhizosphaerae]|uniref:C39 family peptidase n=1 Tax=Allorhizocola rhizosphaerae TaxID=1872709 RepID=UPI001FEC945E|nr:C39 family peptidase [Allorhizocola rhizosphaerae]